MEEASILEELEHAAQPVRYMNAQISFIYTYLFVWFVLLTTGSLALALLYCLFDIAIRF